MKKIITAAVGANGVLTVEIPLGDADAGRPVRVTVEALEPAQCPVKPSDRQAWLRFIHETAGSITDATFERQPQGEYEVRETLP